MKTLIIIITILFVPIHTIAQTNEKEFAEVSFDEYMQLVLLNNFEYLVNQYEVSVAEAAITAARVFEDPELEVILPMFNEDDFDGFPQNISFEMEVPLELFGKRRNRIRLAQAEKLIVDAELDDYLRFLRAEAAFSFVEVLSFQKIIERKNLTLEQLNQLTDVNKALFDAGEIGEIDVLQTRIEARNFEAELFDVKTEYAELLNDVYVLMGAIPTDSLVFSGDISLKSPMVEFNNLREFALSQRSDIVAARKEKQAAEVAMRLARLERTPDITLIAGYHNEGAVTPVPGIKAAYAGVIIPLKFSGFNRGEYRESFYRHEQSKLLLKATTLEVDAELKAAWDKYRLSTQKRMLFTESILEDAEKVRDAVVFSYQRGEVSLLEVLEAQRTMNEMYMNYYEALTQQANSIIELSKSAGQWFVEF